MISFKHSILINLYLNLITSIIEYAKDPLLNEHDSFCDIKYTSTRRQGACALLKSYEWNLPIRVFRSSQLKGEFSPPARKGRKTSYRYDGLYSVTEVFGQDGSPTYTIPKTNDAYCTFYLKRNPTISVNDTGNDYLSLNRLGTSELLMKINFDKMSSYSTKEGITLMNQDTSRKKMKIINDKKVLCVNALNPLRKLGTIEESYQNKKRNFNMDNESKCEAIFAGINVETVGKTYFTEYSNIKMIQNQVYNTKTFPKLICKFVSAKKAHNCKIVPGTKLTVQYSRFFYMATFLKYATSKNGKQEKCWINYDGSRKKSKVKIKISSIHQVHFGCLMKNSVKFQSPQMAKIEMI